jgi:hypothetical protein
MEEEKLIICNYRDNHQSVCYLLDLLIMATSVESWIEQAKPMETSMRKRFDSYKQASKALLNGSESLSCIASAILNDGIILPYPLWAHAAHPIG